MDNLERNLHAVFGELIKGVEILAQQDEELQQRSHSAVAVDANHTAPASVPNSISTVFRLLDQADSISEVLLDADEIRRVVDSLGDRINYDYRDKELVIVCVLKGAFVFCADLVRRLTVPHTVEFMRVKSYEGNVQGDLKVLVDLDADIRSKHVLIVEDIVDTGVTLTKLLAMLRGRDPASVEICSMLRKPTCAKVALDVKYVGREIPDKWVVGYGLDNDEKMRGMPVVGVLKTSA